jgi:hypothetical protein
MLETISSIDDEASSAAAAWALAPLDTWTEAVEIDWLACRCLTVPSQGSPRRGFCSGYLLHRRQSADNEAPPA